MLKPVIAAACLCAATIADAEQTELSGKEIRDLVTGTTVEIDTPLGTKLPVRYAPDGKLSGQARELAPYLGTATDSGSWWIASDRLCHKWTRWFDSEPQCLRLKKEGRTIHWLNQDGKNGTAVIAVRAPVQVAAEAARPKTTQITPPADPDVPAETSAAPTAPAASARAFETFVSAGVAGLPGPAVKPTNTESKAPEVPVPQVQTSSFPAKGSPQARSQPKRPEPSFMVANVDQDDVLNVRSGPSADYDVIGELQPGSRGVTITGTCQSRWCPVRHHATSGWVNRMYLASEGALAADAMSRLAPGDGRHATEEASGAADGVRDSPDAPRTCLTPAAHALLERIERRFGHVKVVSTCRPGALIAGTGRLSRHASGNAVDFNAGSRKTEIVEWLVSNHHEGGTMTYSDMDHVHVDIGPHFVSIAGGRHWASWRDDGRGP